MKQLCLLVFLAVVTVTASAQKDNRIVIGKTDSVNSAILGEKRKILIYTPDMTGYPDPTLRYPVLYLLDGDAHFTSVVGLIQQLSQANGNTVLPEMIVVAIPNTDRTRDLTPTHIANDPPYMDSAASKNTGGGNNFLAFLEKELIPHIDSVYPTAPYRVLVGHSFGGLTVMNALVNHPKLFNAYIAIDPSMWYDRQRFLTATEKSLSQNNYSNTMLYVGIANTMPEGMSLEQMKKDTSADTKHMRSIFELDRFLKAHAQNGLQYASRYYNMDNHASVPLASEYDGLRYIFDYYHINLTTKDFIDSSDGIVSKLKKHYERVSQKLGYKNPPNELAINGLGYNAMHQKYYRRAAALFQMNIENYPNSSNVYDSFGDLLAAQNDTLRAIASYKKALSIKDNAYTRQKLDALEGKQPVKLSNTELQKYTGAYEMETVAVGVTIRVKDNQLWADVTGEGSFQLISVSPDVFTVKDMSGYEVHFQMEGNKAIGFTSIQPNGTFKAHLKQ